MDKIKELRMTLIILLVGMFFFSGCFFSNNKYEVSFKTNGGSEVENILVKSGNTIDEPDTPKKEGYIFEGWYLDGEEYDFDEEVKSDMTLVAKWRKVDISGDKGTDADKEEEEPTTEDTTTTTTKNASTSKTTRRVNFTTTYISVKVKTSTTTTTTTKRVVNDQELASTRPTTTTVAPSETTTVPTTTVAPEDAPKEELRMKIIEIELEDEENNSLDSSDEAIEDETQVPKKYTYEIKFASEDVNVISNLDEEDLQILLTSDKASWIIYNNNGETFDNNYAQDIIILENATKTDSFTIGIPTELGYKYYTLDKEVTIITTEEDSFEEIKWYVNYPSVSLTHVEEVEELLGVETNSITKVYYYSNLETAIENASDNDTINVLKNLNINKTILVDKVLTLKGNGHTITYTGVLGDEESVIDYLFRVENVDSPEGIMTFEDIYFDVSSFMDINENANFMELVLYRVTVKYKNKTITNASKAILKCDTSEDEIFII